MADLFLVVESIAKERDALRAELAEKTRELEEVREQRDFWHGEHDEQMELREDAEKKLTEARAELAEALRGDPDGHICAVYQVLGGDVSELFEGDEPHYERVVRKAKEARAENERLRALAAFIEKRGASLLQLLEQRQSELPNYLAILLQPTRDELCALTAPPAPASPVETRRVLCKACDGEGMALPKSPYDDGVRCVPCRGEGLVDSPAESREDGAS